MALLTAAVLSRAGVSTVGALPTVTTGDTWANTGAEMVAIKNASGGAMVVTLHIPATLDGAAAVDPTISIADGVTEVIGPFPPGIYNDPATGLAKVTCAPVTSSTIKVIKQVLG
jgi:hypothetical protein